MDSRYVISSQLTCQLHKAHLSPSHLMHILRVWNSTDYLLETNLMK